MRQTIVTDEIMGNHPYEFGKFDAEHKQPCVPEQYFMSNDTIVHYTLGFQSVTGPTEATKQLLALYDSAAINKALSPMEWEVRYKQPEGLQWIATEESVMRHQLSVYYGQVDEVVDVMRSAPGQAVIATSLAEYRFIGEATCVVASRAK